MRPDRPVASSTSRRLRVALAAGCISVGGACLAASALAVTPSDPASDATETPGSFDPLENPDAEAPGPAAASSPPPSVMLGGGASGSLVAIGEAWTTWRYGRPRGHAPVDDATTRIRVSGTGRSFEGLIVGFSVGLLVPSLHAGPCTSSTTLAAVWARHDRIDVAPDIEWDSSVADAGASHVALSITSMDEMSHTSERRGGITVDVTHLRLHGTLDAVVPCTRSGAMWRRSCRPETLHGAF